MLALDVHVVVRTVELKVINKKGKISILKIGTK